MIRSLHPKSILALCCCVFVVIFVRNAWICDDAYITLRVVDNAVNGYGLRWNVAERVQAYTHPLWMLLTLLFYSVTREGYFTLLGLSLVLSLAACWRLLQQTRTVMVALAVSLLLLFSKGFVDFTTSGLETPLVYLLLALWLGALLHPGLSGPRRLFYGGLGAALIMLTRLDLAVLVAPAYLALLWSVLRQRVVGLPRLGGLIVLSFLPLIAWLLFALIYYGFALPNTAYAKLNTAIPNAHYWLQGLIYYLTALTYDPVTLLGIAVGIGLGLTMGGPLRFVAVGIILSLLYTGRIGGDFMATRFLAPPLFCAAWIVAAAPWPRRAVALLAGIVLLLGLVNPYNPVQSSADYVGFGILPNGIADERGFYYAFTGLVRITREAPTPTWKWIRYGEEARAEAQELGRRVVEFDTVGMFGYYAGPMVHVIDTEGLADAFIARLPARSDWRIGHFQRDLPAGYIATLESGAPQMEVRALNEYYRRLALVTQGPLFDPARLREIVRFQLGQNDELLSGAIPRQ
jgi:arabinofuranosyltransferase